MLADDFWRLAHNDTTGQPRLHDQAVALGLAAALLAELATAHNITVSAATGITVNPGAPAPGCATAHLVLEELRGEAHHRHDIRTWLSYFARDAHQRVADRMVRAGHLHVEKRRSLLGRTATTYLPTNSIAAATPLGVMSTRVRQRGQIDYDMGCLIGLVWATGLAPVVLDGADAVAGQYLEYIAANLWEPVRTVFAVTRGAVSDAVMARL